MSVNVKDPFHTKLQRLAFKCKLVISRNYPVEVFMFHFISSKPWVANSNCSGGQTRAYKVIRGSHDDADATMAAPEPYQKQLLLTSNFLRMVS